jgi:hypothetical protein
MNFVTWDTLILGFLDENHLTCKEIGEVNGLQKGANICKRSQKRCGHLLKLCPYIFENLTW